MWYIYLSDGKYVNTRTEPAPPYASVKRMPPMPNKSGYVSTLMADFESNTVWWEVAQTEAGKATEVRAMRDALLADCDWTQCLDAPIDTDSQLAYRTYRQALRDVTEQEGFPFDVVWPELPETVKADPDPVDEAVDLMLNGEDEEADDES